MAKANQDQHMKLSPQSHILLLKFFFDKKHSNSPRQISDKNSLSPPQDTHFFLIPPVLNLGLKVVPKQKVGRQDDTVLILMICGRIMKKYLLKFI